MNKYYEEYVPAIKNFIRDHSIAFFPPAAVKGYICPICGSGSGPKGTGMTSKDGVYFTCWRGCFTHLDVIDIMGLKYNTDKYLMKIKAAADEFRIEFKLPKDYSETLVAHCPANTRTHKQNNFVRCEQENETEKDYSKFFEEAHKNIWKTKYHRGLSYKTLNKYQIGFCRKWRHPKAPKAPYSPRLIIPTSNTSYLARDTRNNLNEKQKGYAKCKVGKIHLFNAQAAVKDKKPIFIVEGEIDALSLIDIGAQAIALGSVSNYKKLINLLISNKVSNTIILALDNDDAGKNTADKIAAELQQNSIKCRKANITGNHKDPNEAFVDNKAEFVKMVYKALTKVKNN